MRQKTSPVWLRECKGSRFSLPSLSVIKNISRVEELGESQPWQKEIESKAVLAVGINVLELCG
jgi:hypothetical protein